MARGSRSLCCSSQQGHSVRRLQNPLGVGPKHCSAGWVAIPSPPHHSLGKKKPAHQREERQHRANSLRKCLVEERRQTISENVLLFLIIIFQLFVLSPALTSSLWLFLVKILHTLSLYTVVNTQLCYVTELPWHSWEALPGISGAGHTLTEVSQGYCKFNVFLWDFG